MATIPGIDEPKINVFNVVALAAGASIKIEEFGGSAIAFFFSPGLTLGNTLTVTFGPSGPAMNVTGFNGVYIRLGGPVSEITITNGGAGPITGQLVTSPCASFLVLGL